MAQSLNELITQLNPIKIISPHGVDHNAFDATTNNFVLHCVRNGVPRQLCFETLLRITVQTHSLELVGGQTGSLDQIFIGGITKTGQIVQAHRIA